MNNLRNLRKRKGISIPKLHEMTGIPLRTLEDWDAEKRQIQAYHRVKLLANALNCSMDEVMEKEEPCIYDGKKAFCFLIQWEDGVHITILDDDGEFTELFEELLKDICIPREDALELLKQIRDNKDIKPFLYEYIK